MFVLGITVRQSNLKQLLLVLQYSIKIRCEIIFSAAIDSTDNCRKDKSLGVLSQKFLIMFLLSKVKYPGSYARRFFMQFQRYERLEVSEI